MTAWDKISSTNLFWYVAMMTGSAIVVGDTTLNPNDVATLTVIIAVGMVIGNLTILRQYWMTETNYEEWKK